MKKNLPVKNITSFSERFKKLFALNYFLLIILVAAHAQVTIPASQIKVIKKLKISPALVETPASVSSGAIFSNVTNFLGSAFNNGGATSQFGNSVTTMVADSLGLVGTPPFTIASFTFTVINQNIVNVSARPLIRFYAADGPSGGPGTLIAGYNFGPITFSANNIVLLQENVTFTISTQAIWAGISFDNNEGLTGATLAQLNNLGQGIFNPVDVGTSSDSYFQTSSAGSFYFDTPPGSTNNFSGSPLANFGWEIVPLVPLPVTLDNFKVQNIGSANSLTWSTSQELNSSFFSVEHSTNGNNFSEIGEVKAVGNSNVEHNYQFTDTKPVKGINYYRLRILDIDNAGKYSEIVSVRNNGLMNLIIYPNPVKNSLLVNFNSDKIDKVEINITDMNGRKVYTNKLNVIQGNNSIPVDVNKLSSGSYFIKIQLTNNSYTSKFDKL